MRIGIDARVLEKGITGIGRFLLDLLENIPNHDRKNDYFLFTCSHISFENKFYTKVETGESIIPTKFYAPIWLNFVLPGYLKKYKIDLFFTPNYLSPFRKLRNTKSIIVVSDVVHKVNRKFHSLFYNLYLSTLLPLSISKSNAIITISENSKRDIIKYYGVEAQKITVVYISVSNIFSNSDIESSMKNNVIKKFNLPAKFILYVGVLENRKNILGILKIADLLQKSGKNIQTVLIGKPGFGFKNIIKEIGKRGDYVQYLNFVNDESLNAIYKLAYLFVFPSYYEGFGLPPLESMRVGVPVLASNSSSLLEVIDHGGVMHDPDDHMAFVEDILRLLDDKKYYQEMKEKALLQAQKFDRNLEIKKIFRIFNEI
jgi:glycosyltransferase involved in cell wall biosynthesis